MQAVRFVGVGYPGQIQETTKPSPGPGQVLIRIGGAGVCHSDLHVMEEELGFKPPFTLGHENAGWVAELGQGVMGFKGYLNADSTVVVLGVGGLGHMAIQLLRVLAPVRIVAADVDDKKLQQAKALGADDIVNNRNASEAAERIQQITGPRGAGLVLDCVGVQPTLDLGAKLLG